MEEEEIVIRSSDTDPETVAVFSAAKSVYASWCIEHDLGIVAAGTLRVRPGESFTLYSTDGGTLISGAIDDLRTALDRQPGPHIPRAY
jgi:hypothetical protein